MKRENILFEVSWPVKLTYVFFFCIGLLIFVLTTRAIFLQQGGEGYYLVAPVLLVMSLAVMLFAASFIRRVWWYKVEIQADGTLVESDGNKNKVLKFSKFVGVRRTLIAKEPTESIGLIIGLVLHAVQIPMTFVPSIYGVGVDGGNQEFVPEGPLPIKEVVLTMKAKFPDLIVDPAFSQDVNIWYHKKLFGQISKWNLFWTTFFILLVPIAPIVVYYILKATGYIIQ